MIKAVNQEVIEFYQNDEVSRQAPGKRDVRSIRDKATVKKIKVPIRHLLMNITEAYYEFKKKVTGNKSKFVKVINKQTAPIF